MRYVEYKGGHDNVAAHAAASRGRVQEGKQKKEASKKQFWLLLNVMMQF